MDGIRQHKHAAMGDRVEGQAGNFGVAPFSRVNGGREHPDAGMSHTPMPDHKRAIGGHVARGKGEMPAQRHPDHGPHQHTDFGVGPIPR